MPHIALLRDRMPHDGPDDQRSVNDRDRSRFDRASEPFGGVVAAFGVVTWLLLVAVAAIAPAIW